MTTFETDGFLSAEILEFARTIAGRYARKFELAADTNRLTHRVIYSVKPHSEHAPDLLLAALLIRQASAFQSIVILLRNGLETQSQVLLRNLAEMMFITGAIRKDETFVERYVLAEQVGRLKALEAIVRDKHRRHEEIDADTTRLIVELRAEIERDPPEKFTTERIAGIAGLSSYYDNVYRYTSMAVHSSPRELNTAFVVDADGNVVSMRYEPVIDDLDICFDYGVTMMLYTLHETASHFDLDLVGDIENLQHINQRLAGPTVQQLGARPQ